MRESARKEFEQARFESDPEAVCVDSSEISFGRMPMHVGDETSGERQRSCETDDRESEGTVCLFSLRAICHMQFIDKSAELNASADERRRVR